MCNRGFIHPLALWILTSIFGLAGIFEACPRVPDPDFVIGCRLQGGGKQAGIKSTLVALCSVHWCHFAESV
ncbi:MAG: hypothetical protein OXI63_14685 [Candidatus Poribacteria bacterium]|nr:hypothetical protein [Candidatus Poribacteria bacterium]